MNNERIAYDICPVNIVLNYFVAQLGFNFDDQGKVAAAGKINHELLDRLNNLDFYKKTYPKSLGLEWVKNEVIPLIESFKLEVKDVLKTCVEHIAKQISKEINTKPVASVLVTGGGAYNAYLISRIKFYTNQHIVIPVNEIIEFKEALIFGFLGILKMRGENNCLHSVTGAIRSHSSGKIFLK
jgi:anhydro-N-acetylmuramic acid kinase